jgi:phytoene synthase
MSAAHASSNFRYGILFMPKPQREAVKAIYGFCRAADDAADVDPAKGRENVAMWRQEVELVFKGRPRNAAMQALLPHLKAYQLKRAHFDKILDGMEMDLDHRRYATMTELEGYGDCVAGAVGLLCLQVFGLDGDARAQEYSRQLSYGLQLTNIIRDLKADAAMDRVYFPAEDFSACGYTEAELKKGSVNMNFMRLARLEVGRAQKYFARARESLDRPMRPRLLGPEIMRETYEALLEQMSHGLDMALDGHRARLHPARKLAIACATWLDVKLSR